MDKKSEIYAYHMMHKFVQHDLSIRRNAIKEVGDRIECILEDMIKNASDRAKRKERKSLMLEDLVEEMSNVGYHL